MRAGSEMPDAPVSDAVCSEATGVAAARTGAVSSGRTTLSGEP